MTRQHVGLPAGLHHQRLGSGHPRPPARAREHSAPPQRPPSARTDEPPVANLMGEYIQAVARPPRGRGRPGTVVLVWAPLLQGTARTAFPRHLSPRRQGAASDRRAWDAATSVAGRGGPPSRGAGRTGGAVAVHLKGPSWRPPLDAVTDGSARRSTGDSGVWLVGRRAAARSSAAGNPIVGPAVGGGSTGRRPGRPRPAHGSSPRQRRRSNTEVATALWRAAHRETAFHVKQRPDDRGMWCTWAPMSGPRPSGAAPRGAVASWRTDAASR